MENKKCLIDPNGSFVLKDGKYILDFGYGFIQLYDDERGLLCQFDIDDIPTVDAVEVTHGWWEKDPDMKRWDGHIYDYRCSNCHTPAHKGIYNNNDRLTKYCSECGAKMDLEE